MNTTSVQGAIVIQRPSTYFFGGSRSFLVWIDGCCVGRIRPRSMAEFVVEPGEHTVMASMDWLSTRPTRVQIGPGTKVEIAIGCRSNLLLKMVFRVVVAAVAAPLIIAGPGEAGGPFEGD